MAKTGDQPGWLDAGTGTSRGVHQEQWTYPAASELLREILYQVVSQQQQVLVPATSSMLRPFSAVLLKACSTIGLPKELSEYWLGKYSTNAVLTPVVTATHAAL
jgi:hypothetical protein